MAEKETIMRLEVDLQCEKCYKKVKKVLCKFPQIRDQEFDEKHNIVTIKVVCCNPQKIRDKLCCKGCGAIKIIEIVEPKKPRPSPKPEPPKEPPPKPEAKPQEHKPLPRRTCCVQCYEGRPGGPCFEGCGRPPPCYCVCYYGRPVYYCYCRVRPCYYLSCCDQYISEENPNACIIM